MTKASSTKANERRWMAIVIATALSGVLGMGIIANAGFEKGRLAGIAEGRQQVFHYLSQNNNACWTKAKSKAEARDCVIQFQLAFGALTYKGY